MLEFETPCSSGLTPQLQHLLAMCVFLASCLTTWASVFSAENGANVAPYHLGLLSKMHHSKSSVRRSCHYCEFGIEIPSESVPEGYRSRPNMAL